MMTDLQDIDERLQKLEAKCEEISGKGTITEDDIIRIKRWLLGEPELGVPSLRAQMNELWIVYQRVKWLIYLLLALSGGTGIAVLRVVILGQ